MQKTKLSSYDLLDSVWFVMKTRQDNDMTDCAGADVENDNEL